MTFLLAADAAAIPSLRETWGAVGESVVIVGGDDLWSCHIHTDDIGGAIEAGIGAGRPSRIAVTDLVEQVTHRELDIHGGLSAPAETVAVVAVAVGRGVERLLRNMGARVVVHGGQSMNPSTAELLAAIERCEARGVVVLPNNENVVPVAEAVRALAPCPVAVVPTSSVVEGLTALVAYSPEGSLEDNATAMAAAVSGMRSGSVTRSVRDSHAECGPILAGDWLAIAPDGICAAAASPGDAAIALVEHLLDERSELVTIVLGEQADAVQTGRLKAHLADAHPRVEVEMHAGDQPLYPFLVGVE